MFRLSQSPTVTWPTPITVLDAEGAPHQHTPRLKFKRVSAARRRELLEGARDGSVVDADIAREVLVGWEEGQIVNSDGSNIDPLPENVSALLNVDGLDYWVSKGWFEMSQAGRLGNSRGQLAA
jgi:hypothetical protein